MCQLTVDTDYGKSYFPSAPTLAHVIPEPFSGGTAEFYAVS